MRDLGRFFTNEAKKIFFSSMFAGFYLCVSDTNLPEEVYGRASDAWLRSCPPKKETPLPPRGSRGKFLTRGLLSTSSSPKIL